MIGKWHRTYVKGQPHDLPEKGQKVAVYFFMTGYGIYEFDNSETEELRMSFDTFFNEGGWLSDEDLLWSENLDFAILREPIPEEYLEYPDHYTQNASATFSILPRGNPASVSYREHIKLGVKPLEEPDIAGDVESSRYSASCRAYARQLKRMFPEATFGIKWDSPNLPTAEVVIYYLDPNARKNLTLHYQKRLPTHWDEQALKELSQWVTM